MQKGSVTWTLREVFGAQRIIERVADRIDQAGESRRALAEGLYRWFDARLVTVLALEHWEPAHPARVVHDVYVGAIDDNVRDSWRRSPVYEDLRLDPLARKMLEQRRPVLAARRADLLGDDQWAELPLASTLAQMGVGDMVVGAVRLPGGGAMMVAVHLKAGREIEPEGRQQQMLHAILHRVRRIHLRNNMGANGPLGVPTRLALTRREEQVFRLLLAGRNPKLIATELGVKEQTVAGYIKAIYRHFDVHSRGELMAKYVRV